MAFDTFVKIDGINGESADEKHSGWIEVISFETEVRQKVSSTASSSGGATAERADFKSFAFSKLIDKATPKLSLACADGTHVDSIIIEICRSGGDKLKYMEYKLTNCLISGVISAGGPGEFPAENISINYGQIEWTYTQQKRSGGGAAGQVSAGWSLEKNCKI